MLEHFDKSQRVPSDHAVIDVQCKDQDMFSNIHNKHSPVGLHLHET